MTRLAPLTGCTFTREAVPPFASVDILCSNPHRVDGERRLATMPASEYRVEWMPKEVRLADGTRLAFRDPHH